MPDSDDIPEGVVRSAGDGNAFRLASRILDRSPVPTLYLSAGLVLLQMNQAAGRLLGLEASQALGRPLETLIGPASPLLMLADLAVRELEPSERPVRLRSEEGSGHRYSVTAVPDLSEKGSLLGVLLQALDLETLRPLVCGEIDEAQERKVAELRERDAEMQRRERVFRAVVENSRDGIALGRADGRVLLYNQAMERISGYSMEEVNHHGWFDLVYPSEDDRRTALDTTRRALRGETETETTRITRKDGTERWVSISMAPVTMSEEPYSLVMMRDVTGHRHSMEALLASEESFRLLFEMSASGIAQMDSKGRFARVNRRLAEILGYTQEELQGMTFEDVTYPEDLETSRENVRRLVSGEFDEFSIEKRYVRKDGCVIWGLVTAGLVRDRAGHPMFTTAVIQDMTDRKREEELGLSLYRIDSAVHSTLDFDDILTRVVVEACEALGSEWARIALRQEGEWVTRFGHRLPDESLDARFTDEEVPLFALAASSRKVVAVDTVQGDPRVNPEVAQRLGIRSWLVVPLVSAGEVIGVLSFAYSSTRVSFVPAETAFAERVGSSLSLALENARLFDAQRRIAETLQQAILEIPESFPGIEFGSLYRSASEATRVGGDFIDLFSLPGGRLGLVIGDVSGKGLEAAALTSLVKSVLRAYAYEDPAPASVLARLNRTVDRETLPESFVTLLYAVLDPGTGWLAYCCGGHPPAMLRRASGDVVLLENHSPLVGSLPEVSFVEGYEMIGSGDALLLYTDGTIEARDGGSLFGEERLLQTLREWSAERMQDLCEHVLARIEEFANHHLEDDVALLAIRRCAEGAAEADED